MREDSQINFFHVKRLLDAKGVGVLQVDALKNQ